MRLLTPSAARHAAAGLSLAVLVPVTLAFAAGAAEPQVGLGTAEDFSVLAGAGISNTGSTAFSGSIGSHETPTVTTDTPFTFTGADAEDHAGDAVTQLAKTDLRTGYDTIAGTDSTADIPQELVRNDPYLPGVYRVASSMLLSGPIVLDGGGRLDGVFIFQAPTTLTTASASSVTLVNGAQPCNVFWQVGSSATFGTGTAFVGNVLADEDITATTGATFEGRLLANGGAVTLDTNTFTDPRCEGGDVADDADTDTDTDADGDDTGDDADGTGTDADGGTDPGAGADGIADADSGTDGSGASDGATGLDGDGVPGLPDTGAPATWPLAGGVLLLVAGAALLGVRAAAPGRHRA